MIHETNLPLLEGLLLYSDAYYVVNVKTPLEIVAVEALPVQADGIVEEIQFVAPSLVGKVLSE